MARNNEITNKIVEKLTIAYPRAVSYSDLFRYALPSATHTDQIDKNGGTYLKTLVRQGRAKRVVEGYYCLIPA